MPSYEREPCGVVLRIGERVVGGGREGVWLKRLLYEAFWGVCEDGGGEGRVMKVCLKAPPRGRVVDDVVL